MAAASARGSARLQTSSSPTIDPDGIPTAYTVWPVSTGVPNRRYTSAAYSRTVPDTITPKYPSLTSADICKSYSPTAHHARLRILAPTALDRASLQPITPDCAPMRPAMPDCAPSRPTIPDRVPLRPATPDRAPMRPAMPDCAPSRPATPDRAPMRPITPDCAPLRPTTPDRAPLRSLHAGSRAAWSIYPLP